MEKTRVKEDEMYWCVVTVCNGVQAIQLCDRRLHTDAALFKFGNYFHTKEEAEVMAEKIRAVFNGASVIEMPSNEELFEVKAKLRQNYAPMPNHRDYSTGFWDAIDYLESKVVI